jgi:hypothetical protein
MGGSVCPGAVLDYVCGGLVGESCVMLTCSFCRFTQAALEPASREKLHATFLTAVGHREAFHGLRVQDIAEFDSA